MSYPVDDCPHCLADEVMARLSVPDRVMDDTYQRHPEHPHDWQHKEFNSEEMIDGYVCARCDESIEDLWYCEEQRLEIKEVFGSACEVKE